MPATAAIRPHLPTGMEDAPLADLKARLGFSDSGLSSDEAAARLRQYGFNEIARQLPPSGIRRLWTHLRNPLVILLSILAAVSWFTNDSTSAIVIFSMVVLGVVLRYFQETRADKAAQQLRAMVSTHATVLRDGQQTELPVRLIVPGDL
ncbi:MAG: magnesium-translocating P-type ATPase, partial [Bacteroidetes bacterium]|nr:magnesium-translocating P-type ATPase [Bacteroidota bacterium]